jgi:hypothetical protein
VRCRHHTHDMHAQHELLRPAPRAGERRRAPRGVEGVADGADARAVGVRVWLAQQAPRVEVHRILQSAYREYLGLVTKVEQRAAARKAAEAAAPDHGLLDDSLDNHGSLGWAGMWKIAKVRAHRCSAATCMSSHTAWQPRKDEQPRGLAASGVHMVSACIAAPGCPQHSGAHGACMRHSARAHAKPWSSPRLMPPLSALIRRWAVMQVAAMFAPAKATANGIRAAAKRATDALKALAMRPVRHSVLRPTAAEPAHPPPGAPHVTVTAPTAASAAQHKGGESPLGRVRVFARAVRARGPFVPSVEAVCFDAGGTAHATRSTDRRRTPALPAAPRPSARVLEQAKGWKIRSAPLPLLPDVPVHGHSTQSARCTHTPCTSAAASHSPAAASHASTLPDCTISDLIVCTVPPVHFRMPVVCGSSHDSHCRDAVLPRCACLPVPLLELLWPLQARWARLKLRRRSAS